MTTPTAFPKHQAAIAWAIHQLGKGEVPPGSNTGSFVRYCQSHTFLAGTGWPWCAAFFCTAWADGAHFTLPYRSPGAYDLLHWAQRNAWTPEKQGRQPLPGDGVVFNIGTGHIGILEQLEGKPGSGRVHTVDGNVSDSVGRRIRDRSLIAGYVAVPERHYISPVKAPLVVRVGGAEERSTLQPVHPILRALTLKRP